MPPAENSATLSGLHILIVSLSLLVVIYSGWSGWRNGVVRQVCRFVALGAAYVAAAVGGQVLAPMLPLSDWPPMAVQTITAVGAGALAFLAVTLLSNVLFRKTSEQESGVVRFLFGAGGALLGLIIGAVFLLVLLTGVRMIGTVASAQIAVAEKRHETFSPKRLRYLTEVARAKWIVENGAAGPLLQSIDPIPNSVYSTLDKIARVTADPAAMQRLVEFPATRQLARHPSLANVVRDPAILEELGKRDFLALLRNPKVLGSLLDKSLRPALQKFDLTGALDYALNPPPKPTPSPIPVERD
ncbi:MAG TPA: CvpA family protein [Chthoniobacterales bacterium]